MSGEFMPISFQNDKKKIQYLKTDLQVKNETVSTRDDRPLLRRVCRYQCRGKATPVKDGGCSGSPCRRSDKKLLAILSG